MNIKVHKYAFELNKNQKIDEHNKARGNHKSKKVVGLNKNPFRKINQKIDKDTATT